MLQYALLACIANAGCARCTIAALLLANSVRAIGLRFAALFAARFACSAAYAPLYSQIAALFALRMRAYVHCIAFLLLLYNMYM